MLSTPVLQTSLSSCVHGSLGNQYQCPPSDLLKQVVSCSCSVGVRFVLQAAPLADSFQQAASPRHSVQSAACPSLRLTCMPCVILQLEALVGTLESSFSSSEHMLSSSPASPTALANLKAEKDNRQRLLHQLTLVYPFQHLSTERINACPWLLAAFCARSSEISLAR